MADVGGPSGAPSGRSGARITAALRGSTSPTALWRASLAGDPQVGTSDLPRQARLQFATRAPTPLRRLADDRPRLWGSNTAVRWRTPLFSAQSASLAPTRARRFFFRDSRRPNIGASAARRSGGISPAGELVVDSRARARSRTCTGLLHVPDRPSARARASPSDMRPKIQLSGCAPFPASCHAQERQNAHLGDVLLIRLVVPSHRPRASP